MRFQLLCWNDPGIGFESLTDPGLGLTVATGIAIRWADSPSGPELPRCRPPAISGTPSAPGVPRHELSLNTCSGCHGGESDTFFVHVNPAPTLLSFVPLLSDFLTGTDVIDPTPPPIVTSPPPNVVDPVDGTRRFSPPLRDTVH